LLRIAFTAVISAVLTTASLLTFNILQVNPVLVGATQNPSPAQAITRNTILETDAALEGGVYSLVIAEVNLEPGAATPLHVHPGPSVGFVQQGRLSITVPETGRTSTSAAGSALDHPWERPHIMSNNSDERSRMLSFELLLISPSAGSGE
jgi:quercetin dioxygenase-like cupin family protein